MTTARRLLAAAVVALGGAGASADGMIVPVRPNLRVRGHWAVKYHHVHIKVRDQVAFVNIDQAFVNTGKGDIEVEYLFPVPPGAAIDAMTMVVDGKELAARLLPADQAREVYEDIVRKKKDPALLEYAGFGLYRTRAFPLRAGKPARVVVTYKNVCKKDHDLTEVWYPLNTEKFSAKAIRDVKVTVDIKAEADITGVYSPTHDLSVDREGPRHVVATYHAADTLPVADFQAFYKTTARDVAATFLTHQPYEDADGYFLLLVSPNPRRGRRRAVPKDIVVVLDRSGSMSGKKIDQAVEAATFIINHLNPRDRFNLLTYSDDVQPLFKDLRRVEDEHLAEARGWLDRLDAAGGTNIHEVLCRALGLLADAGRDNRPKYVIFLTDGKPTVGKTSEREILRASRKANEAGARLFAFGVGYNVNVRLLDRLVADHRGRSEYVKPKEPVESKITALYTKIRNPVMTNLQIEVADLGLRDKYPRDLGDLFDGDQLVVYGRYDSRDAAALRRDRKHRTQLLVRGVYQGKERTFEYPVKVGRPRRDLRYEFVETLWAVRRVGFLLDQIQLHGESKELVDEVVRLSKKYGIMTPYTSFLAEETVRLADEAALSVRGSEAVRHLRIVSGGKGQLGAVNRQALKRARRVASDAAAPQPAGPAATSALIAGHSSVRAYEAEEKETVAGVRQVGRDALYRRGRVWIASNAADVDLKKDADRIKVIGRFSEAYFKLIEQNSPAENRLLATQGEDEELLVRLRDQVYRIK
jgi:Ca-activated chloride channel family protein